MTNGIPHRGIPFFVADDVRYNFSVYDVVRKGMPTSMRQGFDNEKYIELQAANIRKRIAQFGGKLYLEFGGKLFDDYHASRVLPGFEPDTKFRMLESLVDDVEIVIAINANHIEKGKTRGDLGIPYDEDVLRLIDVFRSRGFLVGSVVLTQYANQPAADAYRHRLEQLGVTCRLHYPIDAGYAKYETFPIWNLPLNHPVNIAYEAATVDLDDANIIDPFHLEAYGETTVNYNRDVEAFPVLKAMMERIMGESPYQSPTDMGVNMAGYAIVDDDACRDAARLEIVRRYFAAAVHLKRTGTGEEQVERLRSIMNRAGVTPDLSPARAVALEKEAATGAPAGAMVLPDGHVVTGKTGDLLGAASALLMHALKAVTGVDETIPVIDDAAIEPTCRLKTEHLNSVNRRLHSDETLIALSITSATSPVAARVIDGLKQLRGCDAFFSVIISSTDEALYRKLGINVCCEPKYERVSLYHR